MADPMGFAPLRKPTVGSAPQFTVSLTPRYLVGFNEGETFWEAVLELMRSYVGPQKRGCGFFVGGVRGE